MPGSSKDPNKIRDEICDLAYRRERLRVELDLVADAIRAAVVEAQDADIPMAEVARLLGIDRSTLYKVYVGQ